MNDPDDLYFTTFGELAIGQKYRLYANEPWRIRGREDVCYPADAFVQAQRWVPYPVMVTVPADVLGSLLQSLPTDMQHSDPVLGLWNAIHDARGAAES